jgi:LPS sulfotransferase NodH
MTPLRSYLVCATPRSGSTLLCHLLDQTGIAGHPEEYFEALRHSGVPRRPHEYFADLLRGIEGNAGRAVPDLLGRVFPDLRYVQITRQDKVRQAVSLWKAVQTQAWRRDASAEHDPDREPVFSFRAINYLVRLLTAHDASWDAYFLGLGAEPLKVTYEELAEAPDPVVRRVLAHLGIPVPADLALDAPALAVQADARSEEWVRRVHEHLVALESPAAATI